MQCVQEEYITKCYLSTVSVKLRLCKDHVRTHGENILF